jgi:hypothetical protein
MPQPPAASVMAEWSIFAGANEMGMAYALNDMNDPTKPQTKIEAEFFDMRSYLPLIVKPMHSDYAYPSCMRQPGRALAARPSDAVQGF